MQYLIQTPLPEEFFPFEFRENKQKFRLTSDGELAYENQGKWQSTRLFIDPDTSFCYLGDITLDAYPISDIAVLPAIGLRELVRLLDKQGRLYQ